MAVPTGIFIQIFLMILLCGVEVPERFQLYSQFCAGVLFLLTIDSLNGRQLTFICIIDAGPVLDASVISLNQAGLSD